MIPINIEEQKQEAISRMKSLKLYGPVIEDFKNGVLYKSESCGILYWLSEEEKQLVKAFEKEHNAVVYHTIKSYTEFGTLLSLLYVSSCKKEWKMDQEEIESGTPLAYVINLTDESCSEFGCIGVKGMFGGLVRTA